ncbi:MAG: hypothetical protein AAF533_02660 [Acidobacteriota bacterium]
MSPSDDSHDVVGRKSRPGSGKVAWVGDEAAGATGSADGGAPTGSVPLLHPRRARPQRVERPRRSPLSAFVPLLLLAALAALVVPPLLARREVATTRVRTAALVEEVTASHLARHARRRGQQAAVARTLVGLRQRQLAALESCEAQRFCNSRRAALGQSLQLANRLLTDAAADATGVPPDFARVEIEHLRDLAERAPALEMQRILATEILLLEEVGRR